jgi:hypothetical protein
MKPLNEVEHWKIELDEESRQAALDTMILAQIKGLEKLMENNGAHVKSPVAYNVCVGLVDQLRYYALASFRSAEQTLDREMTGGGEPWGSPKFGKP